MFYRRCSVFCRVWLNSKTFTHAAFLTHANHPTHPKILTHTTHAKILWTYTTHATHAKIWPMPPTHPRTHAKHGTHEPTPTMLFSRLKFQIHAAGFVRLLYLVEKGEKVLKKFIFYYWIETRYVLVRENGLYFNMGKVLSHNPRNCQ